LRPSTRDLLLDLLVRTESEELPPPRERPEASLVHALEAEGLIELRAGAYRATVGGLRALEDRGKIPGFSGTVALLFTDFVGSTRLVERLGDSAAHRLLGRQFELLRAAIREHSGREVKSLGDGLMVVFQNASDAVACSAAMQEAVARTGDGLGLRIGIHSGDPVREDADYFGTPVIIARRLCDSAHAGQTLVSEPVQQLVGGCEFQSLECLSLKGLSDPVRASALSEWRLQSAEQAGIVGVAA
jgi:class 3 adenylate cyclase